MKGRHCKQTNPKKVDPLSLKISYNNYWDRPVEFALFTLHHQPDTTLIETCSPSLKNMSNSPISLRILLFTPITFLGEENYTFLKMCERKMRQQLLSNYKKPYFNCFFCCNYCPTFQLLLLIKKIDQLIGGYRIFKKIYNFSFAKKID